MFSSCAFCNAGFDGDGGPSGLGIGRRIAFDEWKGRLWVVCPRCSRWNLTPFDDRLERIEAVARAASLGRIAASTEQVALIRWERYDFVRVGKPPRVELATWRYGERLRNRQRERMKVVVPLTGAEAMQVLRQGLTYLNLSRGGRRRAEDAAREVDMVGGADRLVHDVARRELTLRALRPERGLALEMAVDERAEVEELERQWKEAEEIADIADGTLSTSTE